MKFLIVFVALFALALAAPTESDKVQVLRNDASVDTDGYSFQVETSDGSFKSEEGKLKNVGKENEGIAVRGSFSFVADDGQTYTVNYIADENGFQPQGAHLPVAPEA